MAELHILR